MQLFSSWTGSDFLLVYIALLGACALAAWWLPVRLRSGGRRGGTTDAEDIALLAGGHQSHTDSLIADLFARGGLSNAGRGKLQVAEPGLPASPAGRALLAMRQPFSRGEADALLAIHVSRVTARLRREGLMLRPEEYSRMRWLSITPFLALFLLGLYRQRAGSGLGEPTGFLLILLGITAVLAVIRFLRMDQRSAAGITAVRQMREKSSRLRRAPLPEEAGLAVALFGTAVLVGTPWEPVHALRHQGGDGGGSGGGDSNSNSDGGGDGGSGCGSCGG